VSSSDGALRLLYVGPYNSPHVEDLALAMHERGHVVQAGGEAWSGLPPSSLPEHGVPTSTMTFPSLLWMRRLLRRFRPDVVHAHWLPFAAQAALVGARPLVATAWGSDVFGATGRARLWIRLALLRSALVTADSAALLERLEEVRPKGRKMLVNWGVDLEAFRVPAEHERSELKQRLGLGAGPVILSPRGLKELYNPAVVVEAFERVRGSFPDAQLVLKHGSAEELRPEWNGAPGVRAMGRVEPAVMADLFRAAEITVSIPVSDSSPRSVWEAMASGSATVLSDLPWVHELIVDARDALVVDAEPGAVAAAVERLLEDEALRERIVRSARGLVERHRNRDVELARLEESYRDLARSR
jgi:glycosyltransferase involved in cell wall biosynthesis